MIIYVIQTLRRDPSDCALLWTNTHKKWYLWHNRNGFKNHERTSDKPVGRCCRLAASSKIMSMTSSYLETEPKFAFCHYSVTILSLISVTILSLFLSLNKYSHNIEKTIATGDDSNLEKSSKRLDYFVHGTMHGTTHDWSNGKLVYGQESGKEVVWLHFYPQNIETILPNSPNSKHGAQSCLNWLMGLFDSQAMHSALFNLNLNWMYSNVVWILPLCWSAKFWLNFFIGDTMQCGKVTLPGLFIIFIFVLISTHCWSKTRWRHWASFICHQRSYRSTPNFQIWCRIAPIPRSFCNWCVVYLYMYFCVL